MNTVATIEPDNDERELVRPRGSRTIQPESPEETMYPEPVMEQQHQGGFQNLEICT
jgi:hypothetical protein